MTRSSPGPASPTRVADRAVGRDNNFNLIRVLAATGVLVSHAFPLSLGPEAMQPLERVLHGMTLGTVCVTIFFAVSGFFITRSYDQRRDALAFLLARILRLFPALVVLSLVTVGLALILSTDEAAVVRGAPRYLIKTWLLISIPIGLPGLFVDQPYPWAINGSLWTLFYEFVWYNAVLVLGLVGLLTRRTFVASLVVALVALNLLAAFTELHPKLENLVRLGLPFSAGMALWVWRQQIRLDWRISALLGAVAVGAWFGGAALFQPAFVLWLAYTVILIGFGDVPVLHEYNRLGDYSYGMYLYAFPVQQLMAHLGTRDPFINMALAFPVTLVCAVMSWHFVEAPAQDFGKAIERRRRAALA